MTLSTLTPTARRLMFAACCGAPDSPMTPAEKIDLLRRLRCLTWVPTPTDTPVRFAAIEAWYSEQQRQGLERRSPHA